MRVLVLCEGKTDAVLLSYLLCKVSGWEPIKSYKKIKVRANEKNNEYAFWYGRNDDTLLICGVGGKDKFSRFFNENLIDILYQYPDDISFDKIIVIQDKDNDTIQNIEIRIKDCLSPIATNIKNNVWISNSYTDSFGLTKNIDILGLIIPLENEGALETVLIDSLREESPVKEIVECSENFIDEIKESYAKEYINKPRMELKAKLGVTFAVLSPMKVFAYIDELIRSVEWEKHNTIMTIFEKVLEI